VTESNEFEHGEAEVLQVRSGRVIVACPFPACGGQHSHAASVLNSAEVVAPCSRPSRPRSYSVIAARKPKGTNR
jgi:hypothetical protein